MKNYILTGTAAVVLLFTLPLFGGGEANNNAAVAAETTETAADSLTMPLPEGRFCYRFVITGQMGVHVFEGVEVNSAIGE